MFTLNPWFVVGVLLALISAAGGGFWQGYRTADRSAQIRTLEADARASKKVIAEAQRQAHAANAIAGEAAIRERAASTLALSLQEQIDDYARALAQTPEDACRLGADDVLRLDRMRHGGPAAKPVAPLPPSRPYDLR